MGSTDGDTNGGVIVVVEMVVMVVNVIKENGFGENTMTAACFGCLANSILLPRVIANGGRTPLEMLPHKHLQHTSVRHLGSISAT